MNFFSKTIIFLIIFLLVFNSPGFLRTGFFKLTPNKAEAAFSNIVTDFLILAGKLGRSIFEWIKTNWKEVMRDIVAKRIIDYIVDQTVKWVQGGGDPKFITDWDGFLKDAGDIAFESISRDLLLADLCSPFGLQLKLAFLPVPKFSQRVSCTLDKAVKNIKDFYVDFSVGGWEGYLASWEPQNNFFGAALMIQDEKMLKQAKAVQVAGQKALSGKGFLGVERCKKTAEEAEFSKDYKGKVQPGGGGTTWDATANSDSACASPIFKGTDDEATVKKKQDDYNKCVKDWEQSDKGVEKRGQFDKEMGDKGYKQDTTGAYCDPKNMETTTPGALVGDAVGSAITTDSAWAANISSWVSALVNAVINRLLEKGLSEMKESDKDAEPDYYPEEYADMRASEQGQDKEMMIGEVRRAAANGIGVDTSSITQETLVYASSTLAMFQDMQSRGCSVGANEIATAQSEVDNLLAQGDAQSEADQLINDIRATSPSDTAAWSVILERYNEFINRSNQNMTNRQITNPTYDPIRDAQARLDAAIAQNSAVSARLAVCSAPIAINDGADTTTDVNIVLRLNAASSTSGIVNVTEMMISNDIVFFNSFWEAYSTTRNWTLTAGAGLKTVYVRFRNAANAYSNTFSDNIILQ